ncbi:MAG: hypothetical protein IJ088_12050 [Clostridia bacterium]|nr:hypothetical protein [Clostridia bacterium]
MDMKNLRELDGIKVRKFLGRGRGGYSYLVEFASGEAVLKKMHYESCGLYKFPPDKLKAEVENYKTLTRLNISVPKLLYYNGEKTYLIKEYVDGPTCAELVARGEVPDTCFEQLADICKVLYAEGLNIDYMPHNFVLKDSRLYCIDFECNYYSEEWEFEHWGVFFWVNREGMEYQLRTGSHRLLSLNGKPLVNDDLRQRAQDVLNRNIRLRTFLLAAGRDLSEPHDSVRPIRHETIYHIRAVHDSPDVF